jgi:hypothetical protein
MKKRHCGPLVLVALACLVAGCVPPQNLLQLAPGIRPDSMVFQLTKADGRSAYQGWIYGLSVVECDSDRSFWTISSDGSRSLPSSITYGQPVTGYVTRVGPLPLGPGCYDVVASGASPLRFIIDRSRTIHQQKR